MDTHAIFCSATAGVLATMIAHPFDTAAIYRGTGRMMPTNIAGFYRGLGPALLQGAFMYGAVLGGFETFEEWGWPFWLSAAASAIPESMFRGPMEAWKNLEQTGHRVHGLRFMGTLGRGTVGAITRDVPGNVVYFYTYDFVRTRGGQPWLAGAVTAVA